jgi:hypothetical protein
MSEIKPTEQLRVNSFVRALIPGTLSLAALIYTFGFIIVNSHLSKFGLTSYDTTSDTIFAAGTCYAIFILFIVGLIINSLVKHQMERFVIKLIVFIVGLNTLRWFLSTYALDVAVGIILGIAVWVLIVGGFTYWIYEFWNEATHKDAVLVEYLQLRLRSITIAVLVFVILPYWWGWFFWPYIPNYFGGGEARTASLIIDLEKVSGQNIPYVNLQTSGETEKYKIITENDREYVIDIDNLQGPPVAIKIPREIVLLAIFESEQHLFHRFQQPTTITNTPTITVSPTISTTQTFTPTSTP